MFELDWAKTEREAKRAVELDPNNAEGFKLYGWYYTGQGQFEPAILNLKIAQGLAPLHFGITNDLAWALMLSGKIDEGIEQVLGTASGYRMGKKTGLEFCCTRFQFHGSRFIAIRNGIINEGDSVLATEDEGVVGLNAVTLGAAFHIGSVRRDFWCVSYNRPRRKTVVVSALRPIKL